MVSSMLKKYATAFASLIFGWGIASSQAATLNFQEAGIVDFAGSTSVSLSNAELTSFGDDFFVSAPGVFGEANNLGVVCGVLMGSACETDWEIVFSTAVTDLTFASFAAESGDNVVVSAYNGLSLLTSIVITANTAIDFSGFGPITRLFFNDSSTASGIAFGDFLFEQEVILDDEIAIPLPAAFPLFLAGLAGVGFAGRRRKQ